uniref:tetratricopeptide repeat protein n=1 Tax=Flavobacterium sp. TaxID=239 RepID=UPI00404AEE51
MKTKLTLLLALVINFVSQAQNSEACTETLSLMASSVKAKDPSAYDYLVTLRKDCPNFHKGVYSYGVIAIKLKIDNTTDAVEKEKYVRDLMKLYDEYALNFPQYGKGAKMEKGLALFNYQIGTKQEVFSLFDDAFTNDNANFDNTIALYAYFELFVNDYKAETKNITLQQVFDKYDDISEKLEILQKEDSNEKDALLAKEEAGETLDSKEERLKNKIDNNLENIGIVTSSMDAIIIELSTCEKLIPFYQKSFEENKTNEVWLKRAADRLEAKECDSDPLFSKISEALYKLNPSADAAYKLGVVEVQRGNTTKALGYFNQSASMFTDNSKKAFVYYRMATMYAKNNKSQARIYARKALSLKASYGKAYLLIAQLYGSSINDCGTNPFEKRAIYWLAAQYADKAGAADPSLKSVASKTAASYRASAPTKTQIFESGKAGQRIVFNCWVGESITVPTL